MEFLTQSELAKTLRMSKRTLMRDEKLPHNFPPRIKLSNNCVVYDMKDVAGFIDEQKKRSLENRGVAL